jgi:hypothetical protein
MRSKDKNIVKIFPKNYTLNNGVEYCCVGLKSNDGTNFSVQAYGKEARQLHEQATMMATKSNNASLTMPYQERCSSYI